MVDAEQALDPPGDTAPFSAPLTLPSPNPPAASALPGSKQDLGHAPSQRLSPTPAAPDLPEGFDSRLPPYYIPAEVNSLGLSPFTVKRTNFLAEKACPSFSVYDCPPCLQTFLYDCRVSANGIARELGNFFPLPGIQLAADIQDQLSANTTLGHAARKRRADQLAVLHATNSAIATLNHLAGAPLGDPSLSCETVLQAHLRSLQALLVRTGLFLRECRMHESKVVDHNEWNFDYVIDLHALAADNPDHAPDPELQRGAFCRIVPDRLSLPPDNSGAKVDLRNILPKRELDPRVVLKETPPSDSELGKIPIVKAYNTADYPKIVLRLAKAGIVALSAEKPTCINGLFAVKKDEFHDRFILDGRRANLYFNTPPKVRLPNLADIARIILLSDTRLYAAKADMSNQFYMIACPEEFQTYFGLPHLNVDAALSELTGLPIGSRVWPRMIAIPMGAAWAVNWAQKAQTTVIERAFQGKNVTDPGRLIVGKGLVPLWLSYIDDFIVLAADPSIANNALHAGFAALASVGFVENPNKRFVATHDRFWTPVLGARLSLDGLLTPDPIKVAHAFNLTHNILVSRKASRRQMMQLIGVWVWFLLLNRPFLSILFYVYHLLSPVAGLTRDELDEPVKLSKQVCLELAFLLNVAPLLYANLRFPAHPYLLASDASSEGLGGCWRTIPNGFDIFIPAERSGWYSKHSEDVPSAVTTHPTVIDTCLGGRSQWKTAFTARHANGSPIVLREALAALGMFLRCHVGVSGPTRFLLLVDSTSLLGAFAKGRSSSGRLNLFCRALAAVQACLESRALFAWVSTDLNPADGPSRSVHWT